jgi:hypothetical protein
VSQVLVNFYTYPSPDITLHLTLDYCRLELELLVMAIPSSEVAAVPPGNIDPSPIAGEDSETPSRWRKRRPYVTMTLVFMATQLT